MAVIVGNLAKDPEIRRTTNGSVVANMVVVTSERWKSGDEWKERPEYHRVTVFNEHSARFAEKHLSKGSKVYVQGGLNTKKWQDKEGHDRYTTEIVVQNFKGHLIGITDPDGDNGGWGNDKTDGEEVPF